MGTVRAERDPNSGTSGAGTGAATAGRRTRVEGGADPQIERLEAWSTVEIAARRVELQGRLAREVEPKARIALLREYETIEWIASERGLALPADPEEAGAPTAAMGGQPIKLWIPGEARRMRAMLERELAAGSGYADARAHALQRIGWATAPGTETDRDKRAIADQRLALLDHDAADFRPVFRAEAKRTALSMLDASSVAIDAALRTYGIPRGTARLTNAAHRVARDPAALDGEVDAWFAVAAHDDDNARAYAAGTAKRDALATAAAQLRALQTNIDALVAEQRRLSQRVPAAHCGPTPSSMTAPSAPAPRGAAPMAGSFDPLALSRAAPAASPAARLAFVDGALQMRRSQLRDTWLAAERAHPILAAYRGCGPGDAAALDLGGGDAATTRSVLHHALPKLGNIYRTKAALLGHWGSLDPLRLAPVVDAAKARLFVAPASFRDRVVDDLVASAAHDRSPIEWALEALSLGLTVLSFVPGAGAAAVAGLSLVDVLRNVDGAALEYTNARSLATAANTDLDASRSVSDVEPEQGPGIRELLSTGIDLALAASFVRGGRALEMEELGTSRAAGLLAHKSERVMDVSREQALKDLLIEAQREGVTIQSDAEAVRYLDAAAHRHGVPPSNIHASTLGDVIFVRPEYAENVRILREELIHTFQQKRAAISSAADVVVLEVEARLMMVRHRHRWGMTNDEVVEMISEIRQMRRTGRY